MIQNLTHTQIEPGLLESFRFYYILRTVGGTVPLLVALFLGRVITPLIIGVIMGILLVSYLSSGWTRRRMGRYFIHAAFIIAAVETAVIEKMLSNMILNDTTFHYVDVLSQTMLPTSVEIPFFNILAFEGWRASPPLFFMLIFICWQYSYREVLIYTFALAVFDLLTPLWGAGTTLEAQLTFNSTIIFIRSLSFVVSGYLITRLIEAQRTQRRELQEARIKVTNYATMVEKLTISRERNRMAREMHDTLAHTLSAASVQLEAADSLWDTSQEQARQTLQCALTVTREGLTETRRALQSMRAAPLEELGLSLALQELVKITEQRCGSKVTTDIPEKIDPMSPETEQAIYRITQEVLENIVRHANAKHVDLSLSRDDHYIRLEISDDGIGFDPEKIDIRKRFGLKGVIERVEALGGEIHIHSRPNEGAYMRLALRTT